MKKFSLKFLTPVLALLLLSQFAMSGIAVSVFTDATNDVTKVTWGATALEFTIETVSRPSIDIVSVDYAETAEGNHTITLNLAGAPVLDDETFYWITIEEDAADFSLFIWAGGFTGYNEETPGMLTYTKGTDYAFSIIGPTISSNSLIWNIPQEINYLGFTTILLDYITTDPGDDWEWHIWAWQGTNFGDYSGDWYMDYYPNDDNIYDTSAAGDTSSDEEDDDDGGVPGFEIAALFLSLPIIAVVRKRK